MCDTEASVTQLNLFFFLSESQLPSHSENKTGCVTLASASHMLLLTMSDSEIGGEPAIRF